MVFGCSYRYSLLLIIIHHISSHFITFHISLRQQQDDEDSELKSLITSFKNLTGLWDIDPDDSAWYHLEQKDKNDPSIVVPMGSICYR